MLGVMAAQTDTSIETRAGDSVIPLIEVLMFNAQKLVPLLLTILLPLFIGAFLMRGAGCTYNDLADTDIDAKVARTRSRPLPSGRVSKRQAFGFLIIQGLGGFCVLLFLSRLDPFVFWLGVSSLILVAIYPFMKRVTWWPQLFLGLAFSWGALMGWAIVWRELSIAPILLYIGSICWVIGYDTIYAHQDREDDALVGVKSTARLFGEQSKPVIAALYSGAIILFASAYWFAWPLFTVASDTTELSISKAWPAWIGLVTGGAHMAWQISRLDINDGAECLRLFKSNHNFGWLLFLGLTAALLLM
jgi:4-hydroxybenzoate polyprenyltransferase